MDKTSQKVTKDPRTVERVKKSYETQMKRLKEEILEELSTPTRDPTPSTSSSTSDLRLLRLSIRQDQMILISMVLVCLQSLP